MVLALIGLTVEGRDTSLLFHGASMYFSDVLIDYNDEQKTKYSLSTGAEVPLHHQQVRERGKERFLNRSEGLGASREERDLHPFPPHKDNAGLNIQSLLTDLTAIGS